MGACIKILKITALLIFSLAVFSCSRPISQEIYKRIPNEDGSYEFSINISDSTCLYDIGLYALINLDDDAFQSFNGIPLDIQWLSPTNNLYEERVYLTRNNYIGGNYYSKQFRCSYRDNIKPKLWGKWKLYITIPIIHNYNVQGIGIRLTRKNNGTS